MEVRMKKLYVEKLNAEGFRPFGTYMRLNEIFTDEEYQSDWTFELYRSDNLTMSLGRTNTTAAFSFGLLKTRPLIVDQLQAHCHSEKTLMVEKDCILVVAPIVVGNTVGEDKARAFLVPAQTMIRLNFYTWHSLPFLTDADKAIFAQCEAVRTYNADTHYYDCKEPIQLMV
jgi:ureidoglycolate hydrolase